MKLESIFLGKGKADGKGIRITINMEEVVNNGLVYEFNGKLLLSLDVLEMKKADVYGKTHTVIGKYDADQQVFPEHIIINTPSKDFPKGFGENQNTQATVSEPAEKPKKTSKKKKDELPF
jgi:hypothetical protein